MLSFEMPFSHALMATVSDDRHVPILQPGIFARKLHAMHSAIVTMEMVGKTA